MGPGRGLREHLPFIAWKALRRPEESPREIARRLRLSQSPFRRTPAKADLEAGEKLDALETSESEISFERGVGADGRERPRASRFPHESLELFEHRGFDDIARAVHAERRAS